MLSLNDFQPITIEDKPIFDRFYTKQPAFHSDNLFTTLFGWREFLNFRYTIVDDSLLGMIHCQGATQFRFLSGNLTQDIIRLLFDIAEKEGCDKPIGFFDTQTKQQVLSYYPNLEFIADRNFFDYVYLASDLATLQGTRYAKIRNRLNKFQKNYHYTVEVLTKDCFDETMEFLHRWCLWKDCESDEVLENERKAVMFAMKHFYILGLSGLVLRIDNKIEALAIYEQMNADTAVVHFEKASPDFDGIYKAINMETAQVLQKTYRFIDRQSDLGVPGLRQAKLSYQPHHFIELYHIPKNSILAVK